MPSSKKPILVINFKNFQEIFGEKGLSLALAVQEVSKTLKIPIIVSPPAPLVSVISKNLQIPVYSQHADVDGVGSSTGAIVPELLQSIGVRGSILNHSERRIPLKDIEILIDRLRKIGMKSLVCARTPEEVGIIAKLGPDRIRPRCF
jgi:triosephosphate isomerase